ncbi:uncharacterized protein [Nicotiana tomentosiformis]|uniref:uncharacterized protein n=1 Tax=Nicotiana tomentosiformis TaxID=4098 RepID=UPI00388C8A87
MAEGDTVEGEKTQEVSSLQVEESTEAQQSVLRDYKESAPSLDLNVANPTGNVSPEFTLGLNEQEAIETTLLIAAEGVVVGGCEEVNETVGCQGEGEGYPEESRELVPFENTTSNSTTGKTHEGPVPSAQEEPSTPRNSEEDYDDMHATSFIAARSKKRVPSALTLKRPTTRLQKREALEFMLKKSKEEKKRRRLVKVGKLVNEEEVPLALIVDIDNEVTEEPGSLTRMSLKKPTVPKPRRESSVDEESGEKVSEKSGDNVPEKLSDKSAEKGKSVRKSVKRKDGVNEELGSSKKTKVSVAKEKEEKT